MFDFDMDAKRKRHYVIVLVCVFIHYSFSFLFPLLSLLLIRVGGFSDQESTMVMAAGYLISGGMMPWIGRRFDAGVVWPIIGVGLVGVLLGTFGLMWFDHNLLSVLGVTVAFLIGLGVLQTATYSFVEAGVASAYRAQASSLLAAVGNMGFLVSAALAYYFLSTHETILLTLDALTSVIYFAGLALAIVAVSRSRKQDHGSRSDQDASPLPWRELTGSFLLSIPLFCHFSAIPLLYRSWGLDSVKYTSVIVFVSSVFVIAIGIPVSRNLILRSHRLKLVIAATLTALGSALVPLVSNQLENILVTSVWAAGEVLIYPVTAVAIYAGFRDDEGGRAAGIKTFIFRLCMVVVPLITLPLLSAPRFTYSWLIGLCPLVGAVLIWPAVAKSDRDSKA